MGGHSRNPGYQPGNYWENCDTCGFNYRHSQMQTTWDGLRVCPEDYEPRHPQLDVRGVEDKQAVPISRPDKVDVFNEVTLAANATAGAIFITVSDASDISDEDNIGIVQDDVDDSIHWTSVDGDPAGAVVTLREGLAYAAASGNTVYIAGDSFGSTATVDDL